MASTSSANDPLPAPVFTSVTVPAMCEVRLDVPFGHVVTLKCTSGLAEIHGAELADRVSYDLPPGARVSVFTYAGCTLDIASPRALPRASGVTVSAELDATAAAVAKWTVPPPVPQSQTVAVANLHVALERVREARGIGPRVMVVGAADAGKSATAKTLANYAVKVGRAPLFVDVNPEFPSVSIPGTLAVHPLAAPMDIGLGHSSASAATVASAVGAVPLLFWYGSESLVDRQEGQPAKLGERADVYRAACRAVAGAVEEKCAADAASRAGGVIVDTPGDLPAGEVEFLVKLFKIDIVVHLTPTAPASPLTLPSSSAQLLAIPPVPGASPKDRAYRTRLRLQVIREYFYGPHPASPRHALTPHNIQVPLSILRVARVAGDGLGTTAVTEGSNVVHSVLALSAVPDAATPAVPVDAREVTGMHVLGFVYVSEFHAARGKLDLLVPLPGRLPRKTLVAGTVKWMELS
ncbi:Cleavage polyadenylation factor subunit clp1 [Blastocladiella emersonii ATCC 22665]|nr:Cleavage polyadenylation factor subunit clp1 [Blastocladiella emersonii ATCC 22665]